METLTPPKKAETKNFHINLKSISDLVRQILTDQEGPEDITNFTHNMATNEITRTMSYWLQELNRMQNESNISEIN